MPHDTILPIGGQAVVEGVLMRSHERVAVANRLPNGTIVVKQFPFVSLTKRFRFLGLPLIRGIVLMGEILYLGTKLLIYSTNLQAEEDDQEPLTAWHIFITLLISVGAALLLFKVLPLALTTFFASFGITNSILFNLLDGFFRIGIFLLYLLLIKRFPDVHRLFQYHGAEHKAVHCYEQQKPLTVKNVKTFTTLHERCGTAFLLYSFFLSVLFFSLVPISLSFWKLLFFRLPLLLPIIGFAYELIYLSSKYHHPLLRYLVLPGLWLQKITTQEPDEKQIEVAIKALKAALPKKKETKRGKH